MYSEQELERVAQEYRDEGYSVITHPDKDHLPEFIADLGADLMASRGNEKVLVQVKQTRDDVEADTTVSHRAEIINRQPGWRYDLVVLNEGDPLHRITRGAREPSNEEIDQSLVEVEKLLQTGQNRAALVIAWATLEAAMRRVCSDAALYMPRTTPAELLSTLYGNGILSREDFSLLRQSYKQRTEIVHGLVSPILDHEAVRGVVAATRWLLNGKAAA